VRLPVRIENDLAMAAGWITVAWIAALLVPQKGSPSG
jgi:hypothetical protein